MPDFGFESPTHETLALRDAWAKYYVRLGLHPKSLKLRDLVDKRVSKRKLPN